MTGLALTRSASIVLLHAGALLAQEPGFEEDWRWSRFDTEDGLPGDLVFEVVDAGGVPWAATVEGVAWFDGWRWRRAEEELGLPRGMVTSMSLDHEDNVWVVLHGEVYRGGHDGFQKLTPHATFPAGLIGHVVHPAPGDVLLNYYAREEHRWLVYRWRESSVERIDVPSEASGRNPSLHQTDGGRVYALQNDGLFAWNGAGWELRLGAVGEGVAVTAVAENASGEGIASVEYPPSLAGIWEWNADGEPRHAAGKGPGRLRACAVGPSGEALAVYEAGRARLRRGGEWSDHLEEIHDLGQIVFTTYRENGDLWTGTDEGLLLFRASSTLWTRWHESGANGWREFVNEIVPWRDGTVWIATGDGVTARRPDGERLRVPQLVSGLSVAVTGLAVTDSGRVLASSGSAFQGLFSFNGESWRHIAVDDDGETLGFIHKIRRDDGGRLWLAELTDKPDDLRGEAGTVRVFEAGSLRRWGPFDSVRDCRVYDVLVDENGAVWVATTRGLGRWNGDWTWWDEVSAPALRDPRVIRLGRGRHGRTWFACRHALGSIGADDDIELTELKAVRPGELMDFAIDDQGRIWVTTDSHLYCLDGERWVSFGPESGLDNIDLWPVLPHEGRVFLGSLGSGTFILDPAEAETPAPRVVLSAPTVDGAPVRWRALSWWNRRPSDKIPTSWRLDGGEWSAWSTERELDPTGLDTGRHHLEVRARGVLGDAGEASSIEFSLPLPLYRHPLFLGPLAGLLVALTLLGFGFVRRLREDAAKLRKSEAGFRRLMEQASDAIVICEPETRLCPYVNSKAVELFARSPDAIAGRRLDELLVRSDDALVREIVERGGLVRELDALRPDGRTVPVEANFKRLDDGRVQAILRDLTERRRLERERIAFERELTEMQRLESLGVLAGGVAHDFNNLLTVVTGSADKALRHVEPGSPAEVGMRRVLTAAMRASDLTQQLLAYAGRGSIRVEPLDLNLLVGELGTLFEASAKKGVRFVRRLDPDLPAVEGDRSRLQQVVLNLIVNAAEAIEAEEGEIVLTTRTVRTDETIQRAGWRGDVPPPGRWVLLEVRDDGAGMSEDTAQRVLEPFFTTKFKGRGLGLAAVRGIVRAHGGHLRIVTARGRGSTFSVLLPAAAARPLPGPGGRGDAWRGEGTVLVVDDEPTVREVTLEMCSGLGFDALGAAGGDEAVAIQRARGDDIACTLLDLTMPGMDGIETLDRILAIRPHARVVLMSGYSETQAADGRSQPFLRKPFTSLDLEAALREATNEGVRSGAGSS